MAHVALLGDSVFDNAAYVAGGPDVVHQLRHLLPASWQASLLARDGAVIADIHAQLARLPRDATHLVISIGGNDALLQSGVLDAAVEDVAGALEQLALVRERFQANYAAMLAAALSHGCPTAVCTIYDPRYPDARRRRIGAAALTLLNDAITREAFSRGASLLDLRLICDQDEDFANPIEPSTRGGAKIADAIYHLVTGAPASAAVISR